MEQNYSFNDDMQNITNIQLKVKGSRTYYAIKTSKKWGVLGENKSVLPPISTTHFSSEFKERLEKIGCYISSAFTSQLKITDISTKDDFESEFEVVSLDIGRDVDNQTGESILEISVKCFFSTNKFDEPLEIITPKQSSRSNSLCRRFI